MAKESNPDYYKSYFQYLNPNFSMDWYKAHMISDFPEILSFPKDAKILDLGCGTGQLLAVLQSEGFTDLGGIEFDKGQFEEAKKTVPSARIEQGDALQLLKNSTKKYDAIFMVDVIEHIEKDHIVELLILVKSHLTPKGTLYIRTPNADFPFTASRFRYIDITHTTIFTQESMATVLRLAGFATFQFRPSYIPRSGLKKLIFGFIRLIGDLLLRLYLYIYIHEAAKRMIFSSNFNIVASNEGS